MIVKIAISPINQLCPPNKPDAVIHASDSINVSWKCPDLQSLNVSFIVELCDEDIIWQRCLITQKTAAFVTNLSGNRTYRFRVIARIEENYSDPSESSDPLYLPSLLPQINFDQFGMQDCFA